MGGVVVHAEDRVHASGDGARQGAATAAWFRRRFRVARVAGMIAVLGLVPLAFYAATFALVGKDLGFDVRYAYLPAARDVLHGLSPYASSGAQSIADQTAYVYPPLLAVVLAPIAWVSPLAVSVGAAAVFLLAVLALLYVLGVTDWRCYGATLLWAPTFNAVENVNVSLLLALALALAWRFRELPRVSGLALGVGIAVKVFAWPLLLWQIANRRVRAGIWSLGAAVGGIVLPWAIVAFAGLSTYPSLVREVSATEDDRSYSLIGVFTGLGASAGAARVIAVLAASALVGAVFLLGRRGAEIASLTCAVGAALALSPVVWQHFLVLLLVPLAIAMPRLGVAWFLPMVLWACDLKGDNGRLWQTLLVPGVAVLLGVIICRASATQGSAARRVRAEAPSP